MIRVLHIVGTMDLGGAETLIMNLYRKIDKERIQFDFLCLNRVESFYKNEIEEMGGRMFSIPSIRNSGFLKYNQNLYNFFVSHPEYRIVHSHLGRYNGIILRQAKKASIPCRISHAHACYKNHSFKDRIVISLFKLFFLKSITHAFACSQCAGEDLYIGKWKHDYVFFPNAIDTDLMKFNAQDRIRFRKSIGANDNLVIGHIGRFDLGKNHRFLLQIFLSILKEKPTAILVLIGEGETKKDIEQLSIQYGISDRVHFLGKRQDISTCLSGIDGFIFPSKYEGFGIAAIEAQASGLPVLVSTEVPEETTITNLIKRESLQKSPDVWARDILSMVSCVNTDDRIQYSDVVKKSGFDIIRATEELQNFYLNLVEG